jgi:hypothetical protein
MGILSIEHIGIDDEVLTSRPADADADDDVPS